MDSFREAEFTDEALYVEHFEPSCSETGRSRFSRFQTDWSDPHIWSRGSKCDTDYRAVQSNCACTPVDAL